MDTRYMNYILTLAETGNMTRAAQKLYISQPTLSQFLSKYEKELGFDLFERTKKAYVLTPAGEIYVKYAKKILALERLLEKELKEFGKTVRLNLATSSTQDLKMLSSILADLKETCPDILFSMKNGNTAAMEHLIETGEIDMAFVPVSETDREKFHCQILNMKTEEVLFVASADHPFCQNFSENTIHTLEQSTFAEVFRETPFILHQAGSCISGVENRLFQTLGIEPIAPLRSSLSPSIIDMVSGHMGNGFIPCSEAVAGKSVIYFSLKPQLFHTHAIIFKKDLSLTPPLKRLISLAQEYAKNCWNCMEQPDGLTRE